MTTTILALVLVFAARCRSAVVPMLTAELEGGSTAQFRERHDVFFEQSAVGRKPMDVNVTCGSKEKNYILEVNGGGLVLADFDQDGDPDLVVVDGSTLERALANEPGEPPRLFLNAGDGTFDLAGGKWSMPAGRWGMGGASGDVNGDGWPDLVVTQWGPTRLFMNDAGNGFVEKERAFEGSRWGTSAAFLDFDRDGALDLLVVNYLAFHPDEIKSRADATCRWKGHPVMCGPEGLVPVHDQLYRGDGEGAFTDVTRKAGFQPAKAAFGLGAMTLDYDQDGDTDVYVANDSTPSHLWSNDGDGTFTELGIETGCALDPSGKELAGMGIACGDLDENGFPDIFLTTFSGEPKTFYSAQKGPKGVRFKDQSNKLGLTGPGLVYLGWGTAMEDFDLDGDRDLFALNGHVYPEADRPGTDTTYAQPNHFYRNESGRFVQEPLSDGPPRVSRASSVADLDGDGDLDLVAYELDGRVRVLENRGGSGHWLRVRLSQDGKNRAALGATVTARIGDRRIAGEVRTSGGYQSSVPAEVHLGFGELDSIDELIVRWPDGVETRHPIEGLDRAILVERPADASTSDGDGSEESK